MTILKKVNGRRVKAGLVGYLVEINSARKEEDRPATWQGYEMADLQIWHKYDTLIEAEAEAERLGPLQENNSS